MKRRKRSKVNGNAIKYAFRTALGILLFAILLVAGNASAAPSISASVTEGPPGTSVTVTGSGWMPTGDAQSVEFTLDMIAYPYDDYKLGSTNVKPDGTFQITLTIPQETKPEKYELWGWNSVIQPNENAKVNFTVTPKPEIVPTPENPAEPSQPANQIALKKEATPIAAPEGVVQYTLTLTNNLPPGSSRLSGIQITDKPPSQYITYIMGQPTYSISPAEENYAVAASGAAADVDCSASNILTVSCKIDNFASGATVKIMFRAQLADNIAEDQVITNTASALSPSSPEIKASAETIVMPNMPHEKTYRLSKKITKLLEKMKVIGPNPGKPPTIGEGIQAGSCLIDIIPHTALVGRIKNVPVYSAIFMDLMTGKISRIPVDSLDFAPYKSCVEILGEHKDQIPGR